MLFLRIDSPTTKRVLGFEIGTRALFDKRHANNASWVFMDYNNAKNRSDLPAFLINPTNYYIDKNGNLRASS